MSLAFIGSMAKLTPEKITPGLRELTRDVPEEVKVTYLVQWEGGSGGSVVSNYGLRLTVPAFGRRDSLSATIVLPPNLDVSAVQAVFKKADGSEFPFASDSLSLWDIDAKQVIDALCVDAPFDGVFALVDRVCKGMLDGGVDGADLSRYSITKVGQSVYNSFFPVRKGSQEIAAKEAKLKFIGGSISREETVNVLVNAGYDFGVASRLINVWKDLKFIDGSRMWTTIK
jgi:hypothetical protein